MYSGIEDRVFLERVAVTSYGPQGFTINNDIELHGHVMLLPQLPMLWRPNSENPLEFTRDSFSVLDLLYPKPGKSRVPLALMCFRADCNGNRNKSTISFTGNPGMGCIEWDSSRGDADGICDWSLQCVLHGKPKRRSSTAATTTRRLLMKDQVQSLLDLDSLPEGYVSSDVGSSRLGCRVVPGSISVGLAVDHKRVVASNTLPATSSVRLTLYEEVLVDVSRREIVVPLHHLTRVTLSNHCTVPNSTNHTLYAGYSPSVVALELMINRQ